LKDFKNIGAMLQDEKEKNILFLHKFVLKKRGIETIGYEHNESNRPYVTYALPHTKINPGKTTAIS